MEAIKLCRLDTPIIFIEARINLSRFVVTGCAAKTSATVTFPSLNLISLFARSEERRVGKECRYADYEGHEEILEVAIVEAQELSNLNIQQATAIVAPLYL